MRFAWLCSLFLVACNGDQFNGDAGDAADTDGEGGIPVTEGGNIDSPVNDGGRPTHRLFVANRDTGTLVAWDDADLLSGDRKPDVTNSNLSKPAAMTLAGDRLFVFDDGPGALVAYDKVGAFASSSNPAATLTSPAFVGMPTPHVTQMFWKANGNLLFTSDKMSSAIHMFANATTLTSSATAKARFGQINEGFDGFAIDGQDRLFAGEIPQQVIKYMPGASTKTGANTFTMDFGNPPITVYSMVADSTRLYAGGTVAGQASIAIYDLSKIMPGSTPDILSGAGLPTNSFVYDLQLVNDVLVAVVVGATQKVVVYPSAKGITNQTAPSTLTNDPISAVRTRISEKTGLLYTIGTLKGNVGVQVWKNVTTTPALQAEIHTGIGQPSSLAIYEP